MASYKCFLKYEYIWNRQKKMNFSMFEHIAAMSIDFSFYEGVFEQNLHINDDVIFSQGIQKHIPQIRNF